MSEPGFKMTNEYTRGNTIQMSTFSYLAVYCVYNTIQLVLQACFMCSTSVSLLIFYGLFKINWHAKFLSPIIIKAYYWPGKNILFPKNRNSQIT